MNAIENGSQKASGRIRLQNLAAETSTRIIELRKQGRSFRQIAAEVGFSHGYVGRIVKLQGVSQPPKPLPPAMPKRPRNGQTALPNFQMVSDYEAKGLTVKDAWRDYAKNCSKPYVYTHFSTLYRRWLVEKAERGNSGKDEADGRSSHGDLDVSAEEDHLSELSRKRRLDPRSAVHVLSGFNSSLKVRSDALAAFDAGEERAFPKVTHGLNAIVFLGDGGNITIDAIKWCAAQNVTICVLDWLGDLVSVTTPPATNDVTLRRAQFTADRLAVAKAVIHEKLASGRRIGKLSSQSCRSALADVKAARSVEDVIKIEGRMALEYWSNWRFELKHRKRNWPSQWTLFSYRASQISGGPRHATHPVNAILNYAYSVIAAQITRSLIASGFDSTAGFLHADAQGRHSLTYDVLELLRSDIDEAILPWVASTIWRKADFPVTPSGVVRLQPTLAALVAQKASAACPQAKLDAAVEWIRGAILNASRAAKISTQPQR
jgi:CRISPR-associated protein Cas1